MTYLTVRVVDVQQKRPYDKRRIAELGQQAESDAEPEGESIATMGKTVRLEHEGQRQCDNSSECKFLGVGPGKRKNAWQEHC